MPTNGLPPHSSMTRAVKPAPKRSMRMITLCALILKSSTHCSTVGRSSTKKATSKKRPNTLSALCRRIQKTLWRTSISGAFWKRWEDWKLHGCIYAMLFASIQATRTPTTTWPLFAKSWGLATKLGGIGKRMSSWTPQAHGVATRDSAWLVPKWESQLPFLGSSRVSDQPVMAEQVRAASRQFAGKISGFNKPSQTNEALFLAIVDE